MRLYRICPENLLENYSGRGASYQDGGRWNRAGLPILYFACSASVAMLEMANYLRSSGLIPKSYRLGIFESGDIGFEQWGIEDLPAGWNDYPYPAATQALGSRWLQAASSALLLVPSAAIPGGLENIALVNPAHPDAPQLKLVSVERDIFNKRASLDGPVVADAPPIPVFRGKGVQPGVDLTDNAALEDLMRAEP